MRTYGFPAGVVEHVGVNVEGLASDLVGPATKVSQDTDNGTNVTAGHGDGLAIVQGLDGGQEIGVLLDNVGELENHGATGLRSDLLPCRLKRQTGGGNCGVDILFGGLADRGDDLFGGGIDDLELLLVDALDPLVVDEAGGGPC